MEPRNMGFQLGDMATLPLENRFHELCIRPDQHWGTLKVHAPTEPFTVSAEFAHELATVLHQLADISMRRF